MSIRFAEDEKRFLASSCTVNGIFAPAVKNVALFFGESVCDSCEGG